MAGITFMTAILAVLSTPQRRRGRRSDGGGSGHKAIEGSGHGRDGRQDSGAAVSRTHLSFEGSGPYCWAACLTRENAMSTIAIETVHEGDDVAEAGFRALDRPAPTGAGAPPADDAVRLLARRDGAPVARLSHRVVEGLVDAPGPTGVIGHYEAEDAEAGVDLLRVAGRALAGAGVVRILGPMDGTTWDRYRLVLADPDTVANPPFLTEPTNPADYPRHWAAAGFEPVAHYVTQLLRHLDALAERAGTSEQRLEDAGLHVEPLDPARFDEALDEIHALSLEAFADNLYYSPIGRDRFRAMYRPFRDRVDPDLVLLARDGDDRLAGFIFCVPDLLDPAIADAGRTSRMVVKSLAVAASTRGVGLGSVLMHEAHRRAAEGGFTAAIHALMHVDNPSLRISRHGGELYRRYALFGREP
jgi:GNAT superfamily N-acetyltransferase